MISMHVLVFAPYAINTPHFETALEISQNHLDRGDRVELLVCDSGVPACDPNRHHNLSTCIKCMARGAHGISLLSPGAKVRPFRMLRGSDEKELPLVRTRFQTAEELRRYRIDGFDIGRAVLSSIITMLRDPTPDLKTHASVVKHLMLSALVAFRSMLNLLDQYHADRVYIFNGRFALPRAVLSACQHRNVDCFVHERGHDIHHYSLYENTMPHDLRYVDARIRERWDHASADPERERVAAGFFLDRSKGVMHSWFPFLKHQREGLLPRDWDSGRHNVAVFCSSEDEFAAIEDEWSNPLYDSQLEALGKILASLNASRDDIRLYLRFHPNLAGVENEYTRRLLGLQHPLLTVIPPEDPVSTYALLKRCSVALTFGSTVGIEAVYWGKPSILAGRSSYRNLGGTYNPGSHEDLMELLAKQLPPKNKTAAMMYGYYQATFGSAFKYFRATGVVQGTFKGERLRPDKWSAGAANLLRRFPRLSRTADWAIPADARGKVLGKLMYGRLR